MRSAQEILAGANVIAVVGASRDPFKSAHTVPLQILRHGWLIIPVNPYADEIFGIKTVPTLADLDEPVDLVNVFRPSRDATDVVRQAIAIKAPAVWLQSGIVSAEGRRLAEEAGIDYVEDRCLAVERAVGSLTKLGRSN
jgi:predicted CoA-binding protein